MGGRSDEVIDLYNSWLQFVNPATREDFKSMFSRTGFMWLLQNDPTLLPKGDYNY